jgi:hypothetical protein
MTMKIINIEKDERKKFLKKVLNRLLIETGNLELSGFVFYIQASKTG